MTRVILRMALIWCQDIRTKIVLLRCEVLFDGVDVAKQDDWVRMTLRLPAFLHERLTEAARAASLNAEIVERLDRSFYVDTEDDFLKSLATSKFIEPLPPGLAGRIQATAEANQRSVKEEVVQALEAAFPVEASLLSLREVIDRMKQTLQSPPPWLDSGDLAAMKNYVEASELGMKADPSLGTRAVSVGPLLPPIGADKPEREVRGLDEPKVTPARKARPKK